MRIIATFILLLTQQVIVAQTVINGKIFNNINEPLPYVNIGIIGKQIGTVTNENGKFFLKIPSNLENDTLKLSMLGFIPKNLSISQVLKNKETLEFRMEPKLFQLKELVVKPNNLKERILGNKTESKSITGGFSSNQLGNEVGTLIKIKKNPTYLKSFNISIAKNQYDSLKFRVNVYSVKNGLPNKSILDSNIIITTTLSSGLLSIDLTPYDITVTEDFIITLEWIEDLGTDGLMFSAGVLGSPIISRQASQGVWEKQNGFSLGFNVLVEY